MRVMALFPTSFFFAKFLRVGEDGPGRGHLYHSDTFLVFFNRRQIENLHASILQEGEDGPVSLT